MVLAYHVVFGTYGFWLPNDPRGSGSVIVGSEELYRAGGPATHLQDRTKSRAKVACDWNFIRQLKEHLKRPAVEFTGIQAKAVGEGFGEYVRKSGLVVRACSILEEHVHIVFERWRLKAEPTTNQLKGNATKALIAGNLHPFQGIRENGRQAACWGVGHWQVFLDSPARIEAAIRYVRENPIREGKKIQNWNFVKG